MARQPRSRSKKFPTGWASVRETPQPTRRDTRTRFEQWARNPTCEANAISAVRGIPMVDVAKYEGLRPTFGQSPFALGAGVTFERSLFLRKAERMRGALVRANLIPEGNFAFVDLRLRLNGGPCKTLDIALEKTKAFLAEAAGGTAKAPALIAGATVRIPGDPILPEAILVIDALVSTAEKDRVRLVVGEVKNYPDLGGYTDHEELAGARAQAGIYGHALRVVIEEMGVADRFVVSDSGFLVLRRPGGMLPSLRSNEQLRFQMARAERGLAKLRAIATRLSAASDVDVFDAISKAGTTYAPTCVSYCDRATGCYRRLREAGDPLFLGEDVARYLGSVRLKRAIELLRGAEAVDEVEKDFLIRVQESRGTP